MLPKVIPLDRSTTTRVNTRCQHCVTLLLKQDTSKNVDGCRAIAGDKNIAKKLNKCLSFERNRKPAEIIN